LTKKEYLLQYRELNDRINTQLEEIETWKAFATKITSAYSDMPKGCNSVDRIQLAIERIVLLEAELDKSIDSFVDLKTEIYNKINSIKDYKLSSVLKKIYIDNMSFKDLAKKSGYCSKQISRLHKKAIGLIEL